MRYCMAFVCVQCCVLYVFSGCFRFNKQVAPRFLHLAEGIMRIKGVERFLTLHNDIVYYIFMRCYFVVLYLLYVLAIHDVRKHF